MSTNRHELVETWLREELQPFVGWDFSYLAGRISEEREPWSYLDMASELMERSSSVIDLDTGGGEKLLRLREHWPDRVVATEAYAPNFELASERLSPLGVEVVKVEVTDTSPMPFANGEFDLVLNRHADFNSSEVARVLSPGGTFFTQQVHGMWHWDLQAAFDATPEYPDATPEKFVPLLEKAGLTITSVEEWEGRMVFEDVGAIVYYLKAIPWEVPGFTVRSHLRYLLALQERLEAGEELGFYAAKYLIEARKAGR
ncbi:MAG: methyltransferase domain-containing protein [Chloroflexi bacterium]|nr:methyltransferase domain-containing protein [Chloroflexota bacterium]